MWCRTFWYIYSSADEEQWSINLELQATGRNYEAVAISPQALGKITPNTRTVVFKVLQGSYCKVNLHKNIFINLQ